MKNNFSCVIVDDEPKALELLKDCLTYLYPELIIAACFTTWQDALPALRTEKYDLVFMDISMPGKTGMEVLSLLPGLEAEVIFVTAHHDHALKAFKFAPAGYILKPIDDAQLSVAVDKAIERASYKKLAKSGVTPTALPQKIGIPNNKGTDYINVDDIILLESIKGCTRIATANGDIISAYSLGRFKAIVDKHNFLQVHRSYVINLDHIKRYTAEGEVLLSNGIEIPVSRNFRDEFLLVFNKVSKNDI